MKIRTLLASLILLAGAAFGQNGQFNGGGNQLPSPTGSGQCFISTGSGTGQWTWGACSGAASTNWSAIVPGTGTIGTGTFNVGTSSTLTFTGSGTINASQLGGATFAAPGAIGGTTPGTAAFTTLSATSTVSGAGFTALFASPPAIGGTAAAAGTFTALTATGAVDFSGSSAFKGRVAAGLTTAANGNFGFDSTNLNWHFWNGADLIMAPLAAGFVSGDCGQPTSTAGKWAIADSGSPCGSGGGGGVTNQVKGQTPMSTTSATTIPFSSPDGVRVSAWCGGTSTCPNFTDESFAIQAIVASYNCLTSNNASCNIIDDMTGLQYWSEQPLPNTFTGRLDFRTNGAAHLILVDGMSTVPLPSSTNIHGMGGSQSDQIGQNTEIAMCNPLTDKCVSGGFQIQNTSATTIAISVTGSVMTVTLTAGTPFSVSATAINQLVANRWVCIAGATNANYNGCFTVKAVTQATAPQIFTLNVDSTTQTGSCAAPCGSAVAYLGTPLLAFGTGGGNGSFHTRFGDVILDGHLMIGGFPFVNGQGEEGTGTDNSVQMYNFPLGGFILEQSGIYGGNGSIGTTNAGTYGSLAVNFNPYPITRVAGASCSNSGTGGCVGGTAATGQMITCGAGTSGFAVLTPNPCVNPNWFGAQITGVVGNQGTGEIQRLTVSCQDKTSATNCIFSPNGASQPTGIVVIGQHISFGDTHTEFMRNGADVCGDSAINASIQEAYGTFLTSGVAFHGGFWGYASGGIGIDIGQSGGGALCQDIKVAGMNIGNGSNSLKDNINANTCNDAVISYHLGNTTNPVLENSCTTGQGPEIATMQINTSVTGAGFWKAGVVSPTFGGTGDSNPTAHSLLVTEGASNMSLLTSPTTNGFCDVGFNVSGGVTTDPTCLLAGIPVRTPATPYVASYTDRVTYQRLTGGSTFSFTLPQITGNTASNMPFVLNNQNTGLLTYTANAADAIDGSGLGGTSTLFSGFASLVYQDQTQAPGAWWTIKFPTSAAYPAPTTVGTNVTLAAPAAIYVCTTTCTVTLPVPAAGYEFCVMNDDNVATVITLAALGSSARYENTARTAYGTAGTGTFVSGGAVGDAVCLVGRDATHYLTTSHTGTWTAN